LKVIFIQKGIHCKKYEEGEEKEEEEKKVDLSVFKNCKLTSVELLAFNLSVIPCKSSDAKFPLCLIKHPNRKTCTGGGAYRSIRN
jgi:hypothetical protein